MTRSFRSCFIKNAHNLASLGAENSSDITKSSFSSPELLKSIHIFLTPLFERLNDVNILRTNHNNLLLVVADVLKTKGGDSASSEILAGLDEAFLQVSNRSEEP